MSTKPTCVLYHCTLPLYLFPILFYQSVLPNELTLTLQGNQHGPTSPLMVLIVPLVDCHTSLEAMAAQLGGRYSTEVTPLPEGHNSG